MARERTRPALENEVVTSEKFTYEENEYASEVHTFDAVPFTPSEMLDAAIKNGSVKTSVKTVEFSVNHPSDDKYNDDQPTKVYRQTFTEVSALNLAGATAIFDGDTSKVFEAVSATANRNTFQGVYVDMKNSAQGPEKAIAKVAKLLASLSPAQREAAKAALGL